MPHPPEAYESTAYALAHKGVEAVESWCRANEEHIGPGLALAFERLGQAVLEQGTRPSLQAASRAFHHASVVWRLQGDMQRRFLARLRGLDCRYHWCEVPSCYGAIAKLTRKELPAARKEGVLDAAFGLATLEAECHHLQAKAGNDVSLASRIRVIDRLPQLAEVKAVQSRGWLERFIGLSADVSSMLLDTEVDLTPDEARSVDRKLKTLANKVAPWVADGFAFQVSPMDTGPVVDTLARVLVRYPKHVHLGLFLLAGEARRLMNQGRLPDALGFLARRYVLAQAVSKSGSVITAQRLADIREVFVQSLTNLRGMGRSRTGRLYYGEGIDAGVGEVVLQLMRRTDAAPAVLFELAELLRSRVLLDTLGGHYRLNAQEREHLLSLERAAMTVPTRSPSDALVMSQFEAGWPEHRMRAVQALEEAHTSAESGFVGEEPTLQLDEVQSRLRPDELLVQLVVPYHGLHPAIALELLVIAHDRVVRVPCDLSASTWRSDEVWTGRMSVGDEQRLDAGPANDLLYRTRKAIREGDVATERENLRRLGTLLLDPVIDAGFAPKDYGCWTFVPSKVFHYVPFSALLDAEGRHLIERVAVTIAPSATVWARLADHASVTPVRGLAFGNPVLDYTALPPLRQAQREVERIVQRFDAVAWDQEVGAKASEKAFRDRVEGNHIVHVASHGEFPDANVVDDHQVLLSAEGAFDGRLRAQEVAQLNLGTAELVVLSICNGALYRYGPCDEPYGLVPAFLAAGAKRVVGTLWPLDDAIGRQTMLDFYRALSDRGPAHALQEAIKQLIAADADVDQWASFIVVGTGRGWGASQE